MPKARRPVPASPAAPRRSVFVRAAMQSLLLATFINAIVSGTAYLVSGAIVEQRVTAQVSILASVAEDALERMVSEDRLRAALLASQPDLRQLLVDRDVEDMNRWLRETMAKDSTLRGASLFDADRRAVARVGEGVELPVQGSVSVAVDRDGWNGITVSTPIQSSPGFTLALRFDPLPSLRNLDSSLLAVGRSAALLFLFQHDGEYALLRRAPGRPDGVLWFASLHGRDPVEGPLARALRGEESAGRSEDAEGRAVLAAHRNAPSLGWGIAVQVDRDEALASVGRFGASLLAVAALSFALAIVLALMLARSLTAPILALATQVRTLGPGHWGFKPDVRTGDEVQALSDVIGSMAARLQRTYAFLQEEIQARGAALQRQFALDRAILESIDYGVITVDPAGVVTGANPAACAMLRAPESGVTGANAITLLPLCSGRECVPMQRHPLQEALTKRTPFRGEAHAHLSISLPDGTLLPIVFLCQPLVEKSKVLGAVVVFSDVTEDRKIDEMKSEFITLASHQLRTPLSIMRWHLDLLTDAKKLTAEQKGYVAEMDHAAQRMVNLLNALLQVARLEGGSLHVDAQRVDLCKLVEEAANEASAIAKERNLSLECSVKKTIAQTDPSLLRLVLQNLISNAIKYSPKGGLIRVAVASTESEVRISVADKGMGIPVGDVRRVFEKFFRARNVLQVDTDGSGLGLYICKLIIEGMGGTIAFKSAEGKGTTFTVQLPRKLPTTKTA